MLTQHKYTCGSFEETEGASFKVTMHFVDGYGSGPKSGVHANETNQLTAQDLGITNSFSLTPNMVRLLTENGNMHLCAPAFLAYQENQQYMREKSSQSLRDEVTSLPADFWSAIYSEAIPLAAFEEYLRTHRRTFGDIDLKSFDHVRNACKLVAHVKQSGKQALWWLFWHDIVMSNPEYEPFVRYPNKFSPFDSDSIGFKVIGRDELAEFLQGNGGFSLPSSLLDSLYKALDEQGTGSPVYNPRWLTRDERAQLDQLLTWPQQSEDAAEKDEEEEQAPTLLVVLRRISVRGTPENVVEDGAKKTEMAGDAGAIECAKETEMAGDAGAIEWLDVGAIVEVLEEQLVEGYRCVRIGPNRWIARSTGSGQINLRKLSSSDSLDEVPSWIKILAVREGHSARTWSMFLEQMVETPALARRYFKVVTPVAVLGRGTEDYTGMLGAGTEIEAVSCVDDLDGKSVTANTFEFCSNRPMALVSVPIISLGVYEFANVVQDMLDPETYLQDLKDNGVTFRATQDLNAYTELSADAQPTQIAKGSELKPLQVSFAEISTGTFSMFVRAEQGWIKTIDNTTLLLKWHSTDDDDHHKNKFGPQTVYFQLLRDTSVYAALNGAEKISRARAGTIVEVTRYGPENRYVSVKKNKDKETRMQLVNGGWVCTTMTTKTTDGTADVDVCVPCDPAMERGIEAFVSQPKHVRGTEYLKETTAEAGDTFVSTWRQKQQQQQQQPTGKMSIWQKDKQKEREKETEEEFERERVRYVRRADIDFSIALTDAGQSMIDEDSAAADGAVAPTVSIDQEDANANSTAATPLLDDVKARQFFACVEQSVLAFSSVSGREGPCGQLLRDDVVEVVSTTRGSDGAERLTFEGGHVDSDGMRDITDQVQFFDAPNPPTVPDPAAQLKALIEEFHDIDYGNDRYTEGVEYPRPYPNDFPGAGEPTSAELYACGFPEGSTVDEINAAVIAKAATYGIKVAPLKQQLRKRDPHSFHFPRDGYGRLTHNTGIVTQYQTYSKLVANARGTDPPLFPAEPFEEEGALGSDRGMAVPAPLGVMLPRNKNFIRQARPIKTGSIAANACFMLWVGLIILAMAVAALVTGSLPLFFVFGCSLCLYLFTKETKAQLGVLVVLMVLQLLAVVSVEWALNLLCGPLIGWPYDACLHACDCTCTVGTILRGLTITDSYSVVIAPDMPEQPWANCAAARDKEACLYHMPDSNQTLFDYEWSGFAGTTDGQSLQPFSPISQCGWDEQAAVCTFKCDRIFDPDYCTQTADWGAAAGNVTESPRQYCLLLPEDDVEVESDESAVGMMISFMQTTALRDTSSALRCADCRDSGKC